MSLRGDRDSLELFSNTLVDLYEAAEYLSIEAFPAQIMRMLTDYLAFDGGVLGTGARSIGPGSGLDIETAHIHNRSPSILDDYAFHTAEDPVTQSYVNGLDGPLSVDCGPFYRHLGLSGLDALCANHDIGTLLLFGNPVASELSTKWLVLYREAGQAFSKEDAHRLSAFWPHISRSLRINRLSDDDRQENVGWDRATALVNRKGGIEFADPTFRRMLSVEWGFADTSRLPQALMNILLTTPDYCGQHVRIQTTRLHGYLVCRGKRHAKIKELSPRESVIAMYFAQGHTYREIGKLINLSHHTVRSHLSNAYSKLGIHSKAELIKFMRTN